MAYDRKRNQELLDFSLCIRLVAFSEMGKTGGRGVSRSERLETFARQLVMRIWNAGKTSGLEVETLESSRWYFNSERDHLGDGSH